jgi:hypothetical protein
MLNLSREISTTFLPPLVTIAILLSRIRVAYIRKVQAIKDKMFEENRYEYSPEEEKITQEELFDFEKLMSIVLEKFDNQKFTPYDLDECTRQLGRTVS